MSSARLLMALAVIGLAACAHTPSDNTYLMPSVNDRPPVLFASADVIPEGYDDHVIVSVDVEALREQQRAQLIRDGHLQGHQRGYVLRRSASPVTDSAMTPGGREPALSRDAPRQSESRVFRNRR